MSQNKFQQAAEKPAVVIDCKDKTISSLILDTEKGPLLQALEKGQNVMLRNLDKAVGIDGAGYATLSILLQFSIGELERATICDQQGSPLELNRKGFGRIVGATVTPPANLPYSLLSRLKTISLEKGAAPASKGPSVL
jgi:hypothetical protein